MATQNPTLFEGPAPDWYVGPGVYKVKTTIKERKRRYDTQLNVKENELILCFKSFSNFDKFERHFGKGRITTITKQENSEKFIYVKAHEQWKIYHDIEKAEKIEVSVLDFLFLPMNEADYNLPWQCLIDVLSAVSETKTDFTEDEMNLVKFLLQRVYYYYDKDNLKERQYLSVDESKELRKELNKDVFIRERPSLEGMILQNLREEYESASEPEREILNSKAKNLPFQPNELYNRVTQQSKFTRR